LGAVIVFPVLSHIGGFSLHLYVVRNPRYHCFPEKVPSVPEEGKMRRWGAVITLFYALVLVVLLVPAGLLLVGDISSGAGFQQALKEAYAFGGTWVSMGLLVCAQALLLFLRVDTSFRRLKARAHILVSAATTAFFLGLLTVAGIFSAWVGLKGEKGLNLVDRLPAGAASLLIAWAALWLVWAIAFYLFSRDSGDPVTRAVSWLLRGSVLELLIAVPAHVMVRRRHDCSAPVVTSFGITTGVAIMLMSFGPSVLLLYKKRLDGYSARAAGR
jgi:hypothetical protein